MLNELTRNINITIEAYLRRKEGKSFNPQRGYSEVGEISLTYVQASTHINAKRKIQISALLGFCTEALRLRQTPKNLANTLIEYVNGFKKWGCFPDKSSQLRLMIISAVHLYYPDLVNMQGVDATFNLDALAFRPRVIPSTEDSTIGSSAYEESVGGRALTRETSDSPRGDQVSAHERKIKSLEEKVRAWKVKYEEAMALASERFETIADLQTRLDEFSSAEIAPNARLTVDRDIARREEDEVRTEAEAADAQRRVQRVS